MDDNEPIIGTLSCLTTVVSQERANLSQQLHLMSLDDQLVGIETAEFYGFRICQFSGFNEPIKLYKTSMKDSGFHSLARFFFFLMAVSQGFMFQ